MNSDRDTPCGVGCPIRRPRDHRSLASPPGFSQRATSFIASQCQGIHQMPLLALDPRRNSKGSTMAFRRTKPPRTGASPHKRKAASHEDTSPDTHAQLALRQACPPRSHYKLSLYPSNNIPPRVIPARYLSCSSPNVDGHRRTAPVVEVNGIEPMTSCLQSRRSPN